MLQATFDILLEQPLIISQQAASAGAHQSLDYLPGSVLLGLAASRLYAELDAPSAWTLFHSGQVRFGDALPLDGEAPGFPVPLCWHAYKGEPTQERGQLLAANLFDPSRMLADTSRQPVQLRAGYTTASGRLLTPTRQQTLKTAIAPGTGMAAEGQLFGYEALSAGQRFRFTLSADAGLDADLWQRLAKSLTGTARLGRSRSAQFGHVRITAHAAPALAPGALQDTALTLWLLSDLLLEERGQPCLTPHPDQLGLPEGTHWLPEQSFLRSRRYSAYNAYRRHYDSERQVICRGSVLRFDLPAPLTAEQAQSLQQGVGLQIESGLGSVWVNPPLLAEAQPRFSAAPRRGDAPAQAARKPHSVLIASLEARQRRRLGEAVAEQLAHQLFSQLCQRIRDARRFAATAEGVPLEAPGRSQWGHVKQLASHHRNQPARLWDALGAEQGGMLRERSGWELRYGPQPGQHLGAWLQAQLQPLSTRPDFSRVVGNLAVLGLQQAWLDCCAGTESEEPAA